MKGRVSTRVFSMLLAIVVLLVPSAPLPSAARTPVAEPTAEPPTPHWVLPDHIKAALIDLYNATGGPSWKNNAGWLGPQDPCYWYGVYCSEAAPYSDFRGIALVDNGLSGVLPASMGNLSGAWYIILSKNDLHGPIPPQIGALTSLDQVSLEFNHLEGPIPSSFANLKKLRFLTLGDNNLSGVMPDWLGNLTNLNVLSLRANDLTGPIPATIGNLKNLQHLSLARNRLTGPLPQSLGDMPQLTTLLLAHNQFSGAIPSSLGNLSKLTMLDLTYNELTGPIPRQLGNLTNLQTLTLSANELTGPIPPELGNLTKLQTLGMSGNELTGPIPPELGNLTNLQTLGMSENRLSGPIPPTLGNLRELTGLNLGSNKSNNNPGLSGPIPTSLSALTKLQVLNLSGNSLSGQIPAALLSMPELTELRLADNNLEGDLPAPAAATAGDVEGAAAGSKLQVIDVSYNKLTGIKLTWGAGTPLRSVNLRGNQIEQSIPAALFKIPTLEFIDLGDNKLKGHIPDVAALVNLKILKLDHNNLSGGIPFNIDALRKLEVLNLSYNALDRTLDLPATSVLPHLYFLDLSHNKLWSEVPPQIGLLIGLKTLRLNDNRFTGRIPSELGNLKSLEELDLSRNGFEGGFPECIGELRELKYLAMSHIVPKEPESGRLFGGQLPETFGLLTKLQYLDLNYLYLTGPLPAGMANMTNLTHLDLANNFFDGDVPDGFSRLTKLQYLDMHWTPKLNKSLPLANVVKMKQLTHCNLGFGPVVGGYPIPPEIGDLRNLQFLCLSASGITGEIPSRLGELKLLTVLYLDSNHLVGEIPKEIGNLRALRELVLAGNRLRGSIPAELGNLTELRLLNLGWNRVPEDPSSGLSGELPSSLTDLDKVSTLILAQNRLTGPIHFLDDMDGLKIMNLSDNQFSGFILCNQFEGLEEVYLDHNLLTAPSPGCFPELLHGGLRIVDLSNNRLTGSLGLLSKDIKWFSISDNRLSGNLEGSVQEGSALEHFDVSGNIDMCGPVPIELLKSSKPRYINLGRTQICEPTDLGFQIALAAARLMGFTIISSGLKCAPPPTVSAQVGPSGGTLSSPGDGTTYTFAPGTFGGAAETAIASTAVVTVTHVPKDASAVPSTGNLVGIRHFYDAYARDASGQYVQPQKPYTVTIQYGPIDLASSRARESTLALYRWNGTTWVREPTSRVNVISDTITANPSRFSTWAVLGEPAKIRLLPVIMRQNVE